MVNGMVHNKEDQIKSKLNNLLIIRKNKIKINNFYKN